MTDQGLTRADLEVIEADQTYYMGMTLGDMSKHIREGLPPCACLGPPPGGTRCYCALRIYALRCALAQCKLSPAEPLGVSGD